LDQHVDGIDAGVNQIRKHEIDYAVFAAERNGGFGTIAGEGVETGSLPTRHHKRKSPHADASLLLRKKARNGHLKGQYKGKSFDWKA
jgi:hypothetical protein